MKITTEIWKDIKGYEGLYQISNLGRVKSAINRSNHKHELILKPIKDRDGYYRVHLYKKSKLTTYFIHKLVAETFIPNPDDLPIVNHKDEDKTNNCMNNLEWCTVRYNNSYGNRLINISKTSGKPVQCVETGLIYHSIKEAGRQTGIDYSSIAKNCRGKRSVAGSYHWKYVKKEVV